MNDRPDYVTENWLRCLGLSGKAAKAVMDVHTDQLNALREDKERLDYLESLVLNCPDLTIERVADVDDEESEQREGYVIDIGGCDPARVWGTSLREAIDATREEEAERAKR